MIPPSEVVREDMGAKGNRWRYGHRVCARARCGVRPVSLWHECGCPVTNGMVR